MPPRYSYWTIIADGLPTAFRAAEREELLPTFSRLKQKHPEAQMKWFARGKLWDSPESAREDARQQARGRDWRPGGEHRDPRQQFKDAKRERNVQQRKRKFERRQRFADTGERRFDRPPQERENRPPREREHRPPREQHNRPFRERENRPPREQQNRPFRDRENRPPREQQNRPFRDRENRPPRENQGQARGPRPKWQADRGERRPDHHQKRAPFAKPPASGDWRGGRGFQKKSFARNQEPDQRRPQRPDEPPPERRRREDNEPTPPPRPSEPVIPPPGPPERGRRPKPGKRRP